MKAILPAVLLLNPACGYGLGRTPSVEAAYQIGQVHLASADAAVEAALARALGEGLSKRASLGSGPAVHLELIQSRFDVAAPGASHYRLSMKLRLYMDDSRQSLVSGHRVFPGSGDPAQTRRNREEATHTLAQDLVEEGLLKLLHPGEGA